MESVECAGEVLWFDPSVPARTTREHTAYLLSTFDEAALTYPRTGFPRRNHDADRTRLVSEAGGGIAVVDGRDIGTFKRKADARRTLVTVRPEVDLTTRERAGVTEAAEFLAAFHDMPLEPHLGLSPAGRALRSAPTRCGLLSVTSRWCRTLRAATVRARPRSPRRASR